MGVPPDPLSSPPGNATCIQAKAVRKPDAGWHGPLLWHLLLSCFDRRTKFPPIHSLWRRPSDTGLVVSSLIIVELRLVRDPMEHSGHKFQSNDLFQLKKLLP